MGSTAQQVRSTEELKPSIWFRLWLLAHRFPSLLPAVAIVPLVVVWVRVLPALPRLFEKQAAPLESIPVVGTGRGPTDAFELLAEVKGRLPVAGVPLPGELGASTILLVEGSVTRVGDADSAIGVKVLVDGRVEGVVVASSRGPESRRQLRGLLLLRGLEAGSHELSLAPLNSSTASDEGSTFRLLARRARAKQRE